MSSLYVYWDESNIWGLLLWRALTAWDMPFRLVRGEEIAQGCLSGKPAALLVPGGIARRKYENLGPVGLDAVKDYVDRGGAYIGFCGGAGLGLSGAKGLGLCPWKRRAFSQRLQHFSSGHMLVDPAMGHGLTPKNISPDALLPVWWPARFKPLSDGQVTVLAAYREPGPDFWVADIPLGTVPKGPLEDLETQYGLHFWPRHMTGQPCLITGKYGKGRYVLSYSHLETPDSPEANAWLAHLLTELAGTAVLPPEKSHTPPWVLADLENRWPCKRLIRAKAMIEDCIRLGQENLLLFQRNDWLLGWRRGIPGSSINALYSLISQAQALQPCQAAKDYWNPRADQFMETLEHFQAGLTGYLLAERVAMAIGDSGTVIPDHILRDQRTALFGPPMEPGGLYAALMEVLDPLVWLLLSGDSRT